MEYTDLLCPQHMPELPAHQVLGAQVLFTAASGKLVAGVVEAPASAVGRGVCAARTLGAPVRWLSHGEGDNARDNAELTSELTTAEVFKNAELRRAYDASVKEGAHARRPS